MGLSVAGMRPHARDASRLPRAFRLVDAVVVVVVNVPGRDDLTNHDAAVGGGEEVTGIEDRCAAMSRENLENLVCFFFSFT